MTEKLPEMKPVSSSNIATVGFDPAENKLYVGFLSGTVYRYDGVSQETHDNLVAADSVGCFFNKHVKKSFPYTKVQ